MRFTKIEALGNDFVLIDATEQLPHCDGLARAICDRRRGVGADGLLLLFRAEKPPRVEVWNADGSEAETSGNGLRCSARWLASRGGQGDSEGDRARDPARGATREPTRAPAPDTLSLTLTLATRAGLSTIRVSPAPDGAIRVPLGPPRFRLDEIPMRVPNLASAPPNAVSPNAVSTPADRFVDGRLPGIPFPVTALSVGNPHAVLFVDGPIDAARWGPLIESHAAFPERANVEFVRVVAPDRLVVLMWERGAGPTASSGTGAAAALVAAALTGRAARRARVEMEGGTLEVGWDDNGVWTEGSAREVFEGEWRA